MRVVGNAPANLYEHCLKTTVPIPMREDRQLRRIDLSVDLTDKRQVHPRDKLHKGRVVGIALPADYLEAVDAVLVHGLEYGARE